MSLSSYTILRSEGDERFIAIPVFPSRVFRQNALYVRADSPLRSPSELKGRRIGVGDYQMTAAVWTRGFLQHEYGVRPQDLSWVVGRPIRAIRQPQNVRIEALAAGDTLEAMLERGALDALMTVMIPPALGRTLRRLIPEFREVELAYYRKTRIFPIMHTLVLRRAVYETQPWLAVNLYRAFVRSRDAALRHMYDTDALTVSLPFVIDEIERSREIPWDYSIAGSRPTLEALVQYLDEQELTRRRMDVAELFAPNVDPALGAYLSATGEDA
jgi:4,5-dihydroxyphthalate decarboxylase